MKQEIIPPNSVEARALDARNKASEEQLIQNSITSLKDQTNLVARFRAHIQSGRDAASVLVAMKKDVADAQREVVQHHANLLAKSRKMELSDRFLESVGALTRRVKQRTDEETEYYWHRLEERLQHYEAFFQAKIEETRAKQERGEMDEERAQFHIDLAKRSRNKQIALDVSVVDDLIEATTKVVRKALEDFHPS